MALTQDQWFEKLQRFVPKWWFENDGVIYPPGATIDTEGGDQLTTEAGGHLLTEATEGYTAALFHAMAAVFQQIQQDTDDGQDSTFILDSAAPVLDLIGDERSIVRIASESDSSYAARIQNGLFINVGLQQIQGAVNGVLNNGTGFFIENFQYGYYDDPDLSETPGFLYFDDYYSRWLDMTRWYNWWTVIIPAQSANETNVFANIITAIEDNKALGTTYDVEVEPGNILTEGGDTLVTEDGQSISLT